MNKIEEYWKIKNELLERYADEWTDFNEMLKLNEMLEELEKNWKQKWRIKH